MNGDVYSHRNVIGRLKSRNESALMMWHDLIGVLCIKKNILTGKCRRVCGGFLLMNEEAIVGATGPQTQ